MFGKFVCVIALVTSTAALAGGGRIMETDDLAKLPPGPGNWEDKYRIGKKDTYVDEISRGGWSPQAQARYDSWINGIEGLHAKNCQTPVHYKVDSALCEQMVKLVEYLYDTMGIVLSNNGVSVDEK